VHQVHSHVRASDSALLRRARWLLEGRAMMMNRFALTAGLILASLSACSKSKSPKGACVVAYDSLGSKGLACTVVEDAECKDDMAPAVMDLASSTRKEFTEGKTCADVGYVKAGCSQVPIAWSFKRSCPTP
jgi:hypothetical protein